MGSRDWFVRTSVEIDDVWVTEVQRGILSARIRRIAIQSIDSVDETQSLDGWMALGGSLLVLAGLWLLTMALLFPSVVEGTARMIWTFLAGPVIIAGLIALAASRVDVLLIRSAAGKPIRVARHSGDEDNLARISQALRDQWA